MKTRLFLIFFLLFTATFGAMAMSIQKDIEEEEVVLWANAGIYGAEVTEILIDPSNPDKVWATSTWTNGLFVTTDGGDLWTAVPAFAGGHALGLALDPIDSNIIYAGFGGSVFKSINGGDRWRPYEVDSSTGVSAIVIDPIDPNTLYAGTGRDSDWDTDDTKIYKSTDGGVNWTLSVNLSEDCNDKTVVTDLYIHAGSGVILATTGSRPYQIDGNIYRSADGGETWDCGNAIITADQEESNTAFGMQAIAADGNTLYMTNDSAMYRSDDLGVTWAQVRGGSTAIAINNGRLYAASNNGLEYADLVQCTDLSDPECWTLDTAADYGEAFSLAFSGDTIYLGTGKGVLKSVDNGANWSEKVTGMNGTVAWSGAKSEDGTLYAGMDNLYSGSEDETTHEVAEWNLLKEGFRILDFVVSGSKIILLDWNAQNPVSYRSDSVSPWNNSTIPDGYEGDVFDAIVASGSTVFIGGGDLSGNNGYILKSTDGGVSFSASSTFDHAVRELALDPEDASVVYAGMGSIPTGTATGGGIYKTTNGGVTWTQTGLDTNLTVLKIIVDPLNTNEAGEYPIVYAAANDASTGSNIGKVYKSENGGDNWSELWGGLQTGSNIGLTAMAISFPDTDEGNRVIYAAFENRMIYYSLDSGVAWTYLEIAPYDVNELILGSLYVVTNAGLYRYTQSAPGVDDQGEAAAAGGGCACGGGILHSTS